MRINGVYIFILRFFNHGGVYINELTEFFDFAVKQIFFADLDRTHNIRLIVKGQTCFTRAVRNVYLRKGYSFCGKRTHFFDDSRFHNNRNIGFEFGDF